MTLSTLTLRRTSAIVLALIALCVLVFHALQRAQTIRATTEADLQSLSTAASPALQGADRERREAIVSELVQHPAISAATFSGLDGERAARRRPTGRGNRLLSRFFSEPLMICRSAAGGTLCLEADRAAMEKTLGHDLYPIALLLPVGLLLAILAWGSASGEPRPLRTMTATVEQATREQNYAVRVSGNDAVTDALARAVNTLLEQMHSRDLMLRRRSTELEAVVKELESFSYSISHDLRAPLGSIDGFSQALLDFYSEALDDEGREYLKWIRHASSQMQELVAALLEMSRLNQHELVRSDVDLSAMVESIAANLQQSDAKRVVNFRIEPGLRTSGDQRLLRAVLENMLSNAWKFTRKREAATIEFGAIERDGQRVFFVRDNGAGFDTTQAARLFTAFQRLHSRSDYDGTGIGLATARRVIERHGGTVWAEGEVGRGATFYFTTGERMNATMNDAEQQNERLSA